MDLKLFLELIAGHYVVLTGTTLALFFTTCMILLIRSIGNKNEEAQMGGVTAVIDVKEIEGAMKRVLAAQPLTVASSSVSSGVASPIEGSSEGLGALQAQLSERDVRIEQLTKDLEAVRKINRPSDELNVNVAPADSEETELLRTKLDELQGRLAEYEIIEDDIADLSLFKDENSRLKDENAKLKSMLENAKSVATEAPVSAPTAVVEPEPVVKFEKSDKFELDPEDDVMKEFAAAVSAQPSPTQAPEPSAVKPSVPARDPQAEIDAMLANISVASADSAAPLGEEPLADSADTEKLLNEAQSLASEETTGTSAPETPLPESVDTEKLLNEIDSLKTSQPAAKVEDAEDAFAHFNKAAQG